MPFNQQMSFPVELTLRTFPEGIRLCRQPVGEIERLHAKSHAVRDQALVPGDNLVPDTRWDLFDIRATIELGHAQSAGAFIRGIDLRYHAADEKFTLLGRDIPVRPVDGRLELQVLVDRTSIEMFVDRGKASASFCYLPEASDAPLEFYATGAPVRLVELTVHELKSIWD